MSLPILLSLGWMVLACVSALMPSRDGCRSRSWALIACGVPLLGWATVRHGPIVGLALLAAGAVLLRWPLARPRRRARTG